MPVTYEIDPVKRLIRTRCFGDVTPEEIRLHFVDLEKDPQRPERLDVLLDVREAMSLPDTQDLRDVSHWISEVCKSIRFGACAVVASNDAMFGMMRMFEVLAGDYFDAVQVFKQISAAEAWLSHFEPKSKASA